MTVRTTTRPVVLQWSGLWGLPGLVGSRDVRAASAAAEAMARLPLDEDALQTYAERLLELLDTVEPARAYRGLARAAAHLPRADLRHRLRAIAQDGAHPGRRAANIALSEVGDDTTLAADVAALLRGILDEVTARRLAGLPLERLGDAAARVAADRLVAADRTAGPDPSATSWWTAVAAARAGRSAELDEWLDHLTAAGSAGQLPATAADLATVLPLPRALLDRLDGQLSRAVPAHALLRSVWLVGPTPVPPPRRLDPLAGALAEFRVAIEPDPGAAGRALAAEVAALPHGVAPDPGAVHRAWLDVEPGAEAARPWVAWVLSRAGAAQLVAGLAVALGSTDERTAAEAVLLLRDAIAWSTTAGLPEGAPVPPPWPRPGELIEPAAPPPSDPAGAQPPPAHEWSWSDGDVSFDVRAGGGPNETHGGSVARGEPSTALPPPGGPPGAPPDATGPDGSPRAYATLDCPSAVVAEEEFALEVGLGERPTRGVVAQPLALPDRQAFTLTVQLVVDGFTLRAGERPTVELAVTNERPYPTAVLHLIPTAGAELEPLRSVLAVFSVDGLTVGSASRAVEVVRSADELPPASVVAPAVGVDTAVPTGADAADLTVTISLGDDVAGRRLLWSFQSPHASVPGSAAPLESSLGDRPAEFASALMRDVGRARGTPLERLVRGAARLIGDVVPDEVHGALAAAAVAAGGVPTVLLLSEEPYVPWELARLPVPWSTEAPPLLGAQAVLGRWALRSTGPTADPPRAVAMRAMAVVRGDYTGVMGFKRLPHAEQEATDLAQTYGATLVDAAEGPFYRCLEGEPPAQVLHFAMHGKFDATGLQNGLILVDGVVAPLMVSGSELVGEPFVFLNACQVGQAGTTLGQYGGMAQAFVEAGAAAVIAPLWVVDDEVARAVSRRFYEQVFAGISPAEFLRAERARLQDSGTHLAYVLYGHPLLELSRHEGTLP